MQTCVCGLEGSYQDCCGALIEGNKPAATPEALMRSRYTAYQKRNIDYLVRSAKSPAADQFDRDATAQFADKVEWINLEIVEAPLVATPHQEGAIGFVEFIAQFKMNHELHALHEKSEFHFENGHWYYVDSITPGKKPVTVIHIGRNDPCTCGSQKKYKKCCGI